MSGTAAAALLPVRASVRRRRREAPDVWTLELSPAGEPAAFLPGQFNMLYVPGVGEAAISISGDPARAEPLVHTVRAVGPVSRALAALKPGQSLGLRGPFGTGWPIDEAAGRDVLLVAGGLGLAPLRPALYALLAQRRAIGELALIYGTRSPADRLYRGELARWQRRRNLQLAVTVDHAAADWGGHVGVVTQLLGKVRFDPPRTLALLCGPEPMMRHAAIALTGAGVPESAIHLSMERNMKCAVAHCGRCQFLDTLLCRDGPVLRYDRVRGLLGIREL